MQAVETGDFRHRVVIRRGEDAGAQNLGIPVIMTSFRVIFRNSVEISVEFPGAVEMFYATDSNARARTVSWKLSWKSL